MDIDPALPNALSAGGAALAPGETLDGRYRVEAVIGEGAAGVVFKAWHVHLERWAALKLLRPGAADDRLRREAQALARLKHPHVVEVFDFGSAPGGRAYLATEWLDGRDLLAVARDERATLGTRLEWLAGIAAALDVAHAHGIVHRDVKPENVVLVEAPGGGWSPKVLDFGLARFLSGPLARATATPSVRADELVGGPQERLTDVDALVGTPLYAAPEQVRGPQGAEAADVYSFGVLAYELLVGRPPFVGNVGDVLQAHLRREPPDPRSFAPKLPDEVAQALLRALRKRPDERPRTAGDAARGLVSALADARRRERGARCRRPRLLWGLALGTAVALAGIRGERTDVARWLELRTRDWRTALLSERTLDPRLLLVNVDEQSVRATPASLAERGDEFAEALQDVLAAGAAGVAIDMLVPARWASSAPFSELLVRHPGRITLAAWSSPTGAVVGPECLGAVTRAVLGPMQAADLFGYVNVDTQVDGLVRSGRLAFRDRDGKLRRSWAARAASTLVGSSALPPGPGLVQLGASVRWRDVRRLPWSAVRSALERRPDVFRGRLVLVGGDFAGGADDAHSVPLGTGRAVVSGLVLQALLVDAILSPRVRVPAPWPWIVVAAWLPAGFLIGGLAARARWTIVATLGAAGVYAAVALAALWLWGWLPPLVMPLAAIGLAGLTSIACERLLVERDAREAEASGR